MFGLSSTKGSLRRVCLYRGDVKVGTDKNLKILADEKSSAMDVLSAVSALDDAFESGTLLFVRCVG